MTTEMMQTQAGVLPVGLDVSKATLDVLALGTSKKGSRLKVANEVAGWKRLEAWLQELGSPVHVCLEATGTYSDGVAAFLYTQGYPVSVLNPARVHAFRKTQGTRTKTDGEDALLLAHFCECLHPRLWEPAPQHIAVLRDLVVRLEQLEAMRQAEAHRLSERLHPCEAVRVSLQASMAFLQEQLKGWKQQLWEIIQANEQAQEACTLLTSIPGIAELSASRLYAHLWNWKRYESASQMVAYVGLAPSERQSGTSVKGQPHVCKQGDPQVRKWLYMCALTLMRYDHDIKIWVEQLRQRGKVGKVVVTAVMRKLLHIVYGVLKSGKPYDPRKAFPGHYPVQQAPLTTTHGESHAA